MESRKNGPSGALSRNALRAVAPRRPDRQGGTRAVEPVGGSRVLPHRRPLGNPRRGRADAAGRHLERGLLRDEEEPGPRARRRPAAPHFLPHRHLQGVAHPLFGSARRRLGSTAQQQPHLRRHDTAGLHDQGRPAGDADGAAAPRRAAGWPVTLPRVRLVRRYDTHRLIPAKYADGGASVLADIADDDAHLRDIFDLDNATNDRLLAENGLLPGIGIHELVFGVPYYRIVNAAFCHAHPLGSRFNGPDRGAWYAAFEPETAQAEIAFHKWVELAEV